MTRTVPRPADTERWAQMLACEFNARWAEYPEFYRAYAQRRRQER